MSWGKEPCCEAGENYLFSVSVSNISFCRLRWEGFKRRTCSLLFARGQGYLSSLLLLFLCCWLPPVKLSSGLPRSSALAESQWEPSVQLTFDCVPLRRFACSSLLSKRKRRISCCHPLQVWMLRGSTEESSDYTFVYTYFKWHL